MWIDSHCHLDADEFAADRPQVLAAAAQAGVAAIVIPGYLARYWPRLQQVCASVTQPQLLAAPGLHPCYIDEHQPEHLEQLAVLLQAGGCVAVGEIGLDTFVTSLRDPQPLQRQHWFFREQLQLAQRQGLPVILHVRKAHAEVLRTLRELRFAQGGIVHAFSGGIEEARHYARLGFKLGIGGVLTYPQSRRLRELVVQMPLADLVIETDAPDMVPQARRQPEQRTRNEPAFLLDVVAALSACKGMATPELAEHLWLNTCAALRLQGRLSLQTA